MSEVGVFLLLPIGVCAGSPHFWRKLWGGRFRLLKENAEGTYKTKHAEAARLIYTTTIHIHTDTVFDGTSDLRRKKREGVVY